MPIHKVATCCYCGTRAALILKGSERHELSCSNCGAPLHDLKMLRKDVDAPARPTQVRNMPKARAKPRPTHPKQPHPKPVRKRKHKKRKGLVRVFVEDVFEEVYEFFEDIFD